MQTFITVKTLSVECRASILYICPFSITGFAKLSVSFLFYIFLLSNMWDPKNKILLFFFFICARVKFMGSGTRWQKREMCFQGLGLSFEKNFFHWFLYLALFLLKILYSFNVLASVGLNFVHLRCVLLGLVAMTEQKKSLSSLITPHHSHPRCCQEMSESALRCYCFRTFSRLLFFK